MAETDKTLTRQLDRLARILEGKVPIMQGALSRDVSDVTRLKRVVDAIEEGAVIFKGEAILEGSALKDLSDVADGLSPSTDYVLQFNGTEWVAVPFPPHDLDYLTDVAITTPGDSIWEGDIKDIIQWDGSQFVNHPPQRLIKAITVELPVAGDDITIWKPDANVTIVKLLVVLVGSSTPSVTWTLNDTGFRSGAGSDIHTGTTTNTTAGDIITSFSGDPNITSTSSGRWVRLQIDAMSGNVDEIAMTIYYTEDDR